MKKKWGVLVLIVVFLVGFSVFGYFKYSDDELIEKDPSEIGLSESDVHYSLEEGSYLTSSQFAEGEGQSTAKIQDWGFDRGYFKAFSEDERGFSLIIVRFNSVSGAKSALESISSMHGSRFERLDSPNIGDRSYLYSQGIQDGEEAFTLLFREKNIFVDLTGNISRDEVETYCELVLEKI